MIKKSSYFYEEEGDREKLDLVKELSNTQCILPKPVSRDNKLYHGIERSCYNED